MDLSVIVPVYNGEKTLKDTFLSLIDQENCDFSWEIVAVDDGSKDESLKVLATFEEPAKEKGITLRILPFENKGVGANRNRGIAAARGDVILFLDADDLLLPNALSRLMKIKKEKGAAILLFDSEFLYADGTTSPFPMANAKEGSLSLTEYMLSQPCPWNKLVDRSIFTNHALLFEEGILYEDLALIPALGQYAQGKICYVKEVFHRYYQSEGSIMRGSDPKKRLDIFPALEALYKNAAEHPSELCCLFFLHLYRGAVWDFLANGQKDAVRKANAVMKTHFPNWEKDPLILKNFSPKERFIAKLIYKEYFFLLNLWKGKKE